MYLAWIISRIWWSILWSI